ncbi:hypothetical protein HK101_006291 [Irineochytrium annulatum]|nr:hypothetical protein HK101_006291 [Irineochytrium annulatum]
MSAILCIGIPGWGGAGIMYALSMFGTNLGAAILCAVASSFFILECIMGIWNIKTVYQTYRNLGLSADGARSEAVPTVTSQVVSGSSPGKSSIAAF